MNSDGSAERTTEAERLRVAVEPVADGDRPRRKEGGASGRESARIPGENGASGNFASSALTLR